MESAGGECGDKIFFSLLVFLSCLVRQQTSLRFFLVGGGKMRRAFNKKAQKATHFMLLYERRRRKERKKEKEKCFYSFALFYDKYHCFVPENVSSHTLREHPFMPLPLEFLSHFLLCSPLFFPPIPELCVTQKMCTSF